MNQFMLRAIELANDNVENGGTPYGAVVVYQNEIIGEGFNTLHKEYDISGHAELIAIREAQAVLKTNDLSECTIYASGHPCPMCFGAIGFVGIKTVYYANTLKEASAVGMHLSENIYEYLKGNESPYSIQVVHTPISSRVVDPMTHYKKVIKN